ncbi:MAG: ABC transporter ATP-binding protein [Mobilibacterium timonense]|uniref:ATP-binding cassette domain-containing protein n=1 Tax=Mobilibacterium timonense TaxID=1871012 RepID=UPI00235660BA|nr:ABC transporter ATP-binding protein [Mobilibacterium timonense]MBM6990227.1 ABC transporter ATP-binding protein [Mobilibacterium timonense]
MKNEEPIISFRNVSKSYSEKVVLDNVSIEVRRGEFITLIGRSGCGKTTFLKLINALIKADSGSVIVFGKNVDDVDKIALRRKIGYVIQNVGLFPHMTVRENIEYVPHLFKKPPETTRNTSELMELVSLDESLIDRYPQELSGGQKQRVGIARALATMPELILLDEPFGAVDEITRKQLQRSISDIHEELGLTVVFVTHSIEEAFILGSKVAIFENNGIVQMDEPNSIIANPCDDFVKTLIENTDI